MTGHYDALIAEAERHAKNAQDDAFEAYADAFRRLSAALREAQAHVPPEGWRVTEYTREDGAAIQCRHTVVGKDHWIGSCRNGQYLLRNDGTPEQSWLRSFPTAAAAMAAIEEMGK